MNKHLFPSISIEKIAAYLDNNLPEAEMQEIRSVLSDKDYSPLFEELTSIGDDALTSPIDDSELESLEQLSIPDLQDNDVAPIALFVDDYFIDSFSENTAMDTDSDSIIEPTSGDDF